MKWIIQITLLIIIAPFQAIIADNYLNMDATLHIEMPKNETKEESTDLETISQEVPDEKLVAKESLKETEEDQTIPQSFKEEIPEEPTLQEIAQYSASSEEIIQKKEESCSKKQTIRTISITNSIDDAMLGYSHWTGTYTPKIFCIRVNNKKIGYGKTKKIDIENNKFTVRYDYDFGYNVKKARGAVEVLFKMDKKTSECDLTFSWDNSWRIIIDNATPISEEKCEFDA